MTTIAVIGAGPAGLMAAETAARAGGSVTVFDKMPSPARKFLLAGRGGLNLTNAEPRAAFLARYAHTADRLAPLIDAFSPDDLRAWCADLGEEPFVGASQRVFPKSFKATPLLRAWLARLAGQGVRLQARHDWRGWTHDGQARFATPAGEVAVAAGAVVLALGGASWPRLGADGGWTRHLPEGAVAPLTPSNCGFTLAWSAHMARHAGQPLKNIALSTAGHSVRGEAMITATGLEGQAIYALSRPLREAIARDGAAQIMLDLKPDLSLKEVNQRLSARQSGKSWTTALRASLGLTPAAIAALREAGPFAPAQMAARVKATRLDCLAAAGMDKAISTAGGVRWEGIDENLMLAGRPGVFVAGEMIDWDAPTGGYLLQACFASGARAGAAASAFAKQKGG